MWTIDYKYRYNIRKYDKFNTSPLGKNYLKEIQVEREKGERFEIRMEIFDFLLFENHICWLSPWKWRIQIYFMLVWEICSFYQVKWYYFVNWLTSHLIKLVSSSIHFPWFSIFRKLLSGRSRFFFDFEPKARTMNYAFYLLVISLLRLFKLVIATIIIYLVITTYHLVITTFYLVITKFYLVITTSYYSLFSQLIWHF